MPYMVKGKKCITGACTGGGLVAGAPMKRFGMALGGPVKTSTAYRVGRTATDPCCDYPQQPCCNDRSLRLRTRNLGEYVGVGADVVLQHETASGSPGSLFDYAKDILQSAAGGVAQVAATAAGVVKPTQTPVKPPMSTTTKIAIAGGVTLGAVVLLKLFKK